MTIDEDKDIVLPWVKPGDWLTQAILPKGMEFKCPTFYTDLRVAVDRIPRIIATVHRNYIHTAEKLGFEIIWLTRENWNSTLSTVLKALSLST